MSLSEEREEFYQDSLKLCTNEEEELLVKNIFIWIDKQDKELAKKLKEEIKRGVTRNKVFPLDWCFDSIDTIFGFQGTGENDAS